MFQLAALLIDRCRRLDGCIASNGVHMGGPGDICILSS